MNCILCLHVAGKIVPASAVMDGYSVCQHHQQQIADQAHNIRFDSAGRFHLRATVEAMRKAQT